MRVGILDCDSGNLHSAAKAFAHLCDAGEVQLVRRAEQLEQAERIVLPGVGAFAACAAALRARTGLEAALKRCVLEERRPFLGICVGMQLMGDASTEHQRTQGLGFVAGEIRALRPAPNGALKIPHMGWNQLQCRSPHPVLDGLNGRDFYFVHSWAPPASAPSCLAVCEHGEAFCAVWGRANMIGTQFHPEKSQRAGLQLLNNFLRWQP